MNELDNVLTQLRRAGLIIDSTTLEIDSGDMVRCKVEGDKGRKTSGFYRVFSTRTDKGVLYFGVYGSWKDTGTPEGGYKLKFDATGLSREEQQAISSRQEQAKKQTEKERIKKQREAAENATRIWGALSDNGSSQYLKNKKVSPEGVRFGRGGSVCVPLLNAIGAMVGLQFIQPDSSKRFLTGTAKTGAFHLIGTIPDDSTPIAIAEGYATAASVHMATGWPVVVAFDAGNLGPVADIFATKHPKKQLVIAADNDQAGTSKANKAAERTGALVALPQFKNDKAGAVDWNDLHCIEGIKETRRQLLATLNDQNPKPPPEPAKSTKAEKTAPENPLPVGFSLKKTGVWFEDTENEQQFWVCGPLSVVARTRNIDSKDWGLLVRFDDYDHNEREWNISMRLFASDGGARVVEGLLDLGLSIDPNRNSKRRLLDYLHRYDAIQRVLLVGKLGWHGNAYMLPNNQTIGTPKEALYYYRDKKPLNKAATHGTLADWQNNIAHYCIGNIGLMFAVSTAFAGPLLKLLNHETFGFHYVGESSLGKSTIARVAASVCGGLDYVRTWNATSSALEPIAAEHSDSLLILDEISQSDPFTTGQTVYQLGNGEGKSRATDTGGGTRVQQSWRLVFLSNGERTLDEHISAVGKRSQAGMDMRLLNVTACTHQSEEHRKRLGVFQDIHDFAHGAALSDYLKDQCAAHHGHAHMAFIEHLTNMNEAQHQKLASYLQSKMSEFSHQHLSENASGQARRASMKFALIGLAGELAIKASIAPWPKGAALDAASALFRGWMDSRGGEGNAEDIAVLKHLLHELQTKAEIHFTRWETDEPKTDSHAPRTGERWGFRKTISSDNFSNEVYTDEEFYIYKESFEYALCKGHDYKRARSLLKEKGVLTSSNKNRPYTSQRLLPGGGAKKHDVYVIRMSLLMTGADGDTSLAD